MSTPTSSSPSAQQRRHTLMRRAIASFLIGAMLVVVAVFSGTDSRVAAATISFNQGLEQVNSTTQSPTGWVRDTFGTNTGTWGLTSALPPVQRWVARHRRHVLRPLGVVSDLRNLGFRGLQEDLLRLEILDQRTGSEEDIDLDTGDTANATGSERHNWHQLRNRPRVSRSSRDR